MNCATNWSTKLWNVCYLALSSVIILLLICSSILRKEVIAYLGSTDIGFLTFVDRLEWDLIYIGSLAGLLEALDHSQVGGLLLVLWRKLSLSLVLHYSCRYVMSLGWFWWSCCQYDSLICISAHFRWLRCVDRAQSAIIYRRETTDVWICRCLATLLGDIFASNRGRHSTCALLDQFDFQATFTRDRFRLLARTWGCSGHLYRASLILNTTNKLDLGLLNVHFGYFGIRAQNTDSKQRWWDWTSSTVSTVIS